MPARHLARNHYETLAAFRHALREFLRFSQAAAREAGIPPQQHQALLVLKGTPRMRPLLIGDLAAGLHLRHHSAVGLVDRLERRGWVQRRPSRQDRRRVEIRLTRKGDALVARLSAAHLRELRALGPELRALLARVERG